MYDNPFQVPDTPFATWRQMRALQPKDPNATAQDALIFQHYLTFFINAALARYKYKNLPEEIPPVMIEKYLLFRGNCVFFKEQGMFGVTGVSLQGNLDIYGIPEDRFAFSCTSFNKLYNKDNSVIIWSRPFNIPEILGIELHSTTITDMRVSRDINIIQQRTPVLVAGEQNAKVDSNNLIQKFLHGIPFIKVNKNAIRNLSLSSVETLDLHVPAIFEQLDDTIIKEKCECLAELGIYATSNTKRERLTSDENYQNAGLIESARNQGLMCRQRACEQINKLWPELNVSVEFNTNIDIGIDENMDGITPHGELTSGGDD